MAFVQEQPIQHKLRRTFIWCVCYCRLSPTHVIRPLPDDCDNGLKLILLLCLHAVAIASDVLWATCQSFLFKGCLACMHGQQMRRYVQIFIHKHQIKKLSVHADWIVLSAGCEWGSVCQGMGGSRSCQPCRGSVAASTQRQAHIVHPASV
jgi:hypothetical protein